VTHSPAQSPPHPSPHSSPTANQPQGADAVMFITPRPNLTMVRGQGSWLWDDQGKRYLDFVQGWAVNSLGHSPKVLRQALARQAGVLVNASPAFYNNAMLDFAGWLTRQSGLDRVFFANSGAEANEGAVKLARKWGKVHRHGAFEVITTHNSFHGRTLAMMSASGKPGWDKLFEPKVPGFPKVPFNDLDAMAHAITPKTAAILVEPVQGEGGVIVPSPHYLTGLRKLCDEKGVLLMLDEIQTGMGRTGTLFAFQRHGILPDVMTLGKGLGGGFPVAAVLARQPVCLFEAGEQGGTFNGQPLAMAAGLAVAQEIERKRLAERAEKNGRYLQKKLNAMGKTLGLTSVRGQGLLVAVDLPQEKGPQVVAAALQAGLLVNSPRPATLRLMPALTVSRGEIDQMLDMLEQVLKQVL